MSPYLGPNNFYAFYYNTLLLNYNTVIVFYLPWIAWFQCLIFGEIKNSILLLRFYLSIFISGNFSKCPYLLDVHPVKVIIVNPNNNLDLNSNLNLVYNEHTKSKLPYMGIHILKQVYNSIILSIIITPI